MTSSARRLWHAIEPLHAIAYFSPETVGGWREIGLRGFWMGYFASRASAMGAVGPEVITATFFNFHPAMVRRAVPDAWGYAAPADVLRMWRERSVGAELDGCAAHVLAVAAQGNVRDAIQPNRGWTDEDWAAAQDGLRARGWLDGAGSLTPEGRRAREEIERRTDELAFAPLEALGPERTERALPALAPLTAAVWAADGLPHPNPIGLPKPGPAA